MPILPSVFGPIILPFASLFSQEVWGQAQTLLLGAILAPGKRTVTSALRVMGLSHQRHFQNYHRVLNRAAWSCGHASFILLHLLLAAFAPQGPLILGIDDTIERRWGAKIAARGIYRDPVRSSDSHFVKASGLRWISLMLLVPIPWAERVWALPFLSALAPSERYWNQRHQKRKPKLLTDFARQLVLRVRRWLPSRSLVVVADGAFAALELLARWARAPLPITCITRLRLDARLFAPAPARQHKVGRPRLVGKRLPSLQQVLHQSTTVWQRLRFRSWYRERHRLVEIASGTAVWYHGGKPPLPIRWVLVRDPKGKFETMALLCTDPHQTPRQIVEWYLWRWQVEVTFQEVRAHLGVETQRQWSDLAIARTTPVLLGLFSIVTLLAQQFARGGRLPVRQAAWYVKPRATFSDTIALVRQRIWQHPLLFSNSRRKVTIPHRLVLALHEAACYAQ